MSLSKFEFVRVPDTKFHNWNNTDSEQMTIFSFPLINNDTALCGELHVDKIYKRNVFFFSPSPLFSFNHIAYKDLNIRESFCIIRCL